MLEKYFRRKKSKREEKREGGRGKKMKAGINEHLNANHCYGQLVNYYPCSLQNESGDLKSC